MSRLEHVGRRGRYGRERPCGPNEGCAHEAFFHLSHVLAGQGFRSLCVPVSHGFEDGPVFGEGLLGASFDGGGAVLEKPKDLHKDLQGLRQLLVVAGLGQQVVEVLALLVDPAGGFRARDLLQALAQVRLHLREILAGGPLSGETGGHAFQHFPDLEGADDVLLRQRDHRSATPGVDLHQALGLQPPQRFPDRRTAGAERLGELAFHQALPERQPPFQDRPLQVVMDLIRQGAQGPRSHQLLDAHARPPLLRLVSRCRAQANSNITQGASGNQVAASWRTTLPPFITKTTRMRASGSSQGRP